MRELLSVSLHVQALFTFCLRFPSTVSFSYFVSCFVFQRNCREKAVSRRWVTARVPQVAAFLVTLKVTALLCPPTRASRSAFTPQLFPRAASPPSQGTASPPLHPITGNCFPSCVQMNAVSCNVDFSFHRSSVEWKAARILSRQRGNEAEACMRALSNCHLIVTCVSNMSYVGRKKFSFVIYLV